MTRLPASAPPTETYYPPTGFFFSLQTVDPGGGTAGSSAKLDMAFQEASGLSVEISTESYAEGGLNGYRHRLPAAPKYPDLVLKRGYVAQSLPLYRWCEETLQQGFARRIQPKLLVLQLLSPDPNTGLTGVVRQWDFYGAWPIKWSISDFNASKNEVLIETLTFSYRYFSAS